MKSTISSKCFHNEETAYAWVESLLWPNGPVCPHCGGFDRISKMGGNSTRIGTYKCYQCRKQFTVKGRYRFRRQLRPERIYSSRASDGPFTRCSSNRDMLG